MRPCSKCGETKPLSEYYEQANCKDGRRPSCKECDKARVSAHRAANVEEHRQRDHERYVNNPERRARQIATARSHYNADRTRQMELRRVYYEAHPEVFEKSRAKRRARLKDVEHKPYTRREIYDRDGGRCRVCSVELSFEPNGFTIDHIVPLDLHGPDIPSNVELMCWPCNREKWANLEGQIHFGC